MSKSSFAHRIVVALPLALVACGGGGGSGGGSGSPTPTVTGNGLAPSSGPGDTALYFPSTQGNEWSYNYTTDDPAALSMFGIATAAVNGTKAVQGQEATVFTDTNPTRAGGAYDQYFYLNAGGVTLMGNSDTTDTITPLIAPYVQLLFPVQVGAVSNITATNLALGKDSSGHQITLNLRQTITNVATESVDVPAGTFANAMHQRTTVSGTAYDSGQSTPAVSGTDDVWMVAGIGQVKEQSTITGGTTQVDSASELRAYTVNGKTHGLGAAVNVNPDLVSANCLGASGFNSPVNVASDGTNFIAVALACDNRSGSTVLTWVATLIGPDGTVKGSTNLTPATVHSPLDYVGLHSAIAFDGTNYLIVHEDDYSAGSAPNIEALLVSRSGSVLAGPQVVGVASLNDPFSADTLALAFDGARYLLVFNSTADPNTHGQMAGQFISPSTAQVDGTAFAISNSPNYTRDGPAVAFDGANYLVVWGESGMSPVGLRAMRVSRTGALLDATPLLVMDATGAGTNSTGVCCHLSPTVSFDGTNYLVAYRDPRGAANLYGDAATVSAARVSTAGALLDGTATTPGIVITSAAGVVVDRVRSTYFGGAHWLVWGSATSLSLSASRVSPSGTVPSAWRNGFALVPSSTTNPIAQWPAIATGVNSASVVWLQADSGMSSITALWDLPIYSSGP